jgi:hypothetical protein
MHWLPEAPMLRLVLFLLLALIGYVLVYGVAFPLLWPYRARTPILTTTPTTWNEHARNWLNPKNGPMDSRSSTPT